MVRGDAGLQGDGYRGSGGVSLAVGDGDGDVITTLGRSGTRRDRITTCLCGGCVHPGVGGAHASQGAFGRIHAADGVVEWITIGVSGIDRDQNRTSVRIGMGDDVGHDRGHVGCRGGGDVDGVGGDAAVGVGGGEGDGVVDAGAGGGVDVVPADDGHSAVFGLVDADGDLVAVAVTDIVDLIGDRPTGRGADRRHRKRRRRVGFGDGDGDGLVVAVPPWPSLTVMSNVQCRPRGGRGVVAGRRWGCKSRRRWRR